MIASHFANGVDVCVMWPLSVEVVKSPLHYMLQ